MYVRVYECLPVHMFVCMYVIYVLVYALDRFDDAGGEHSGQTVPRGRGAAFTVTLPISRRRGLRVLASISNAESYASSLNQT